MRNASFDKGSGGFSSSKFPALKVCIVEFHLSDLARQEIYRLQQARH
jgi:hypothetical protein